MKVQRHSTLKVLALFAILGPPTTALVMLFWLHVFGEPPLPADLFLWLVFAFPAAYLHAGVPALVTGCSAVMSRAMAPGGGFGSSFFRLAVPLAAGATASLLFSLVTIASEPDALIAVGGGLAALVCAALAEWMLR